MKLFNYEFKKSKYPIFKICFWILIICSIIGVLYIQKTNAYYFNIKDIAPLKPISLNISFSHIPNEKYFVCFDEFCSSPKYTSQTANLGNFNFIKNDKFDFKNENFFSIKIKNVYFAVPKDINNLENKIEKIDLFISNDYKKYDFNEFKNFEKKEVSIIQDDSKEKTNYVIYKIPNSSNYIGLKNHILILISSLIFCFKVYIIPYIWLFAAILIFLFNNDAFKIKFKNKLLIALSSGLFFAAVCLFSYFLLLKNTVYDDYINFVRDDIKSYSNDYKINIYKNSKNDFSKLKNVSLHDFDLKNDKMITKIKKKDYIKDDEKAVIYLNSDMANTDILSINNPSCEIYKTNFKDIIKIVYE